MASQHPRVMTDSLSIAYAWAVEHLEPVFLPVQVYTDDRGWSIMNQMQGIMSADGQINYSVVYPAVVKAWHRHQYQCDFWLPLHGQTKVGVYREDDGVTWSTVFGEKRPGVMIIPPLLWHGTATVGHEPVGMLYYVTRAYNASSPDEERRPYDSIETFSWEVQHG